MSVMRFFIFNFNRREDSALGLHIALYEPQIPANTGNIARTSAGTDTTLHLIHPLGFSTSDKMLKRAGLDYWHSVNIHEHESLEAMYKLYKDATYYFIENFGTTYYTDMDYSDSEEEIFFIFGKETTGIPKEVIKGKEDHCLRIPMTDKIRSLNLSNTVAIILYEALRQQSYRSLT